MSGPDLTRIFKAMSKPRIDRLVKQATREAASTFQQVQKFSAETPEITAAFTTLKLALLNPSPSLSQSMVLAEEVFSQLGTEEVFSQFGHEDVQDELAPVDDNAMMTEREWPAEWYTFGRFIERILESLHTQDGQLHPTTYSVAGVLVVTFLSGSWRELAVLAILSLWLRDVHTRATKDDANEP